MSKPDYLKYDGRKPEPPYQTEADMTAPQSDSETPLTDAVLRQTNSHIAIRDHARTLELALRAAERERDEAHEARAGLRDLRDRLYARCHELMETVIAAEQRATEAETRLAAVRDKTLEEAASVCDAGQVKHGPLASTPWETGYEAAERVLAHAIRALRDAKGGSDK